MSGVNATLCSGLRSRMEKNILCCTARNEDCEDYSIEASGIEENYLASYVPVDPRDLVALGNLEGVCRHCLVNNK